MSFTLFHCSKIVTLNVKIFSNSKFDPRIKIDLCFQFWTPLSEIIFIVCSNICDPDRFGQNFAQWNRVGIANNFSLSIKVRTSLLNRSRWSLLSFNSDNCGLFVCRLISTQLPRWIFWHRGGSNSITGYACIRPRAYSLTLRLRPGVRRSIEGGKEI